MDKAVDNPPLPIAPIEGGIVLCGLGRIGLGILALLRRLGEPVTVITRNTQKQVLPSGDGVQVLVGDARDEKLLAQAGIAKAKALIVATHDDMANVTIALHARNAAPDLPVVTRLFDQDLAKRLECTLGLRRGYSASALAAPAFVAASMGDRTRTLLELSGETWAIEDMVVADGSPLLGRTVEDGLGPSRVLLAHVREGVATFAPDGNQRLEKGDRLTVIARPSREAPGNRPSVGRLGRLVRTLQQVWRNTPKGLRYSLFVMLAVIVASVGIFHAVLGLSPVDAYYFVVSTLTTTGYGDFNLQAAPPIVKIYGTLVMVLGGCFFAVVFSLLTDLLLRTRFSDVLAQGASHYKDHIIVAGLGNTGFRVLRLLCAQGEHVVAIENQETQKFLSTARSMVPVIVGDAGASETLQRAGLAGAKAVLALTDNNLTNLSIALATKQARPDCRVVVRVFDETLAARMHKTLHIDGVLSVSEAVVPTFVGAALDARVIRGLVMHGHFLALLERSQPGPVCGNERVVMVRGQSGGYEPAGKQAASPASDVVFCWTKLKT